MKIKILLVLYWHLLIDTPEPKSLSAIFVLNAIYPFLWSTKNTVIAGPSPTSIVSLLSPSQTALPWVSSPHLLPSLFNRCQLMRKTSTKQDTESEMGLD